MMVKRKTNISQSSITTKSRIETIISIITAIIGTLIISTSQVDTTSTSRIQQW